VPDTNADEDNEKDERGNSDGNDVDSGVSVAVRVRCLHVVIVRVAFGVAHRAARAARAHRGLISGAVTRVKRGT